MTAPQPLPMLRPFQAAVDFQLSRVPKLRSELEGLSDEARAHAFWISGLAKRHSIEEATRLAQAALAKGLTKGEFVEQLGKILDRDGSVLSAAHIDTIAENNLAISYCAGRWSKMNDPDILRLRPFRQYPLGPHDTRTTPICLKLEGMVWEAGDPIEDHVMPPNHDRERHKQVLTLTREQAESIGIYKSAGDAVYPVIDGETILPNLRWDFSPRLFAANDSALAEMAAGLGDVVNAFGPEKYGLQPLTALEEVPALPASADAVGWSEFQTTVGIDEGARSTILVDVNGDGALLTRGSFEALGGEGAGLIRSVLEEPAEIWMVPREHGATKVMLGIFDDDGTLRGMWLEMGPQGWVMAGGVDDVGQLQSVRRGWLVFSKLRKPS